MTIYAYEIAASAVSGIGRVSLDGEKVTFRADQLAQTGISADDPRLVAVANSQLEWAEYVNTPGGDYTPEPTIEEMAAMAEAEKQALIGILYAEVKASRLKYAPDLPLQARAYELKADISLNWDGEPPPPRAVKASATRKGIDEVEAKAQIDAAAILYDQKLVETEALREEGLAAINAGQDLQPIIAALRAI